jgi:uncharacterized RDD family membrane protein YckC
VAAQPVALQEEFAFTIAIGRPAKQRSSDETRMVIDVSVPCENESEFTHSIEPQPARTHDRLYAVASMLDRRIAGAIDAACLLFAYGGFLMLFGSLGGQFTASKLSSAVYLATFAVVYMQYVALFTIFGSTTPGMMMRGLQVLSFSDEPPTGKQMLLRTLGYAISGATLFVGFLWAMWDEDELTWHDRFSRTYLSQTPVLDIETSSVAHSR